MNTSDLHDTVGKLLEQAPNEHGIGAIASALSSLGASGFGQSVQQGTATAQPAEQKSLGDMLTGAISQGGGSPQSALSQLGIGGGALGPSELGKLAEYTANNHSDALASVLGNQMGSGGGGSILKLLGNPMAREIGTNLAKRLM